MLAGMHNNEEANDEAIKPRSLNRSVAGIAFRRFYWWCHTCPVRTGLVIGAVAIAIIVLQPEQPVESMKVRVTAYWSVGKGTDKWTARGMSSTGVPLRENQSAAVDPAVIPYGSRIVWREGGKIWKAVDTGSAVKDRTAAIAWGKDVPVVDVFFENREDAIAWTYEVPKFISVDIFPPEEGWKEELKQQEPAGESPVAENSPDAEANS